MPLIRIHFTDETPPLDLQLKNGKWNQIDVGRPAMWLAKDSKTETFHLTVSGGLVDFTKVANLEVVHD